MEFQLACKVRQSRGTNEAGRERRAGSIPGNLIHDARSVPISFDGATFAKMLQAGVRQSSILHLMVDGAPEEDRDVKVIIKEVQRHPVSGDVLHVDFYRTLPDRKVKVHVAIETTGVAKGVKAGGAMEHYIRSLVVKALPGDLMESLKIDISALDVGESVHLSDIQLPAGWEILTRGNPLICKVSRARVAAEAAPAAQS